MVQWTDTYTGVGTTDYLAKKILEITQTPAMGQSAISFKTGGGTCTDILTHVSVACMTYAMIITVDGSLYDYTVVAANIKNSLIGTGSLCQAGVAPELNDCLTNTPVEKTTAFFQNPTRSGSAYANWKVLTVREGGIAIKIKGAGTVLAESNGDPHLHRADGHKTDFRGEDGKIFNMLSARNFSLGVRTVDSHFMQKHGTQKVHGSHFTEAFFTIRTNMTGTILTARADALITPWLDPVTLVAIQGKEKYPIKLSSSTRPTFTIEDVNITAVSGSKLVVRAATWEVAIVRRPLYKPLPESKTKNYLDLTMRRITKDPRALASHGVVGQSFDPKHRIYKDGKTDDYSKDEVTTTAQAEGAIEGVYTDYMVGAPYQTTFKYSVFDAPPEMATAAQMAAAFTEASTETNEAAAP